MTDVPPQGGGGNILTRKIGPLPGWAWLIAIALLAYLYMSNKSKQANNAQQQSQAQNSGGAVLTNSSGQPIDTLQTETVATPIQNPDTQTQGYQPQGGRHPHNPVNTDSGTPADSLGNTNGASADTTNTTQTTVPQTGSTSTS